jgi:hypothetical protein
MAGLEEGGPDMEPRIRSLWAALLTVSVMVVSAGPAMAESHDRDDREVRIDALAAEVGRPLAGTTVDAWVESLTSAVGHPIDRGTVNAYLASMSGSSGRTGDTDLNVYLTSLADSVGRPIDASMVDAWVTDWAESVGRPIDAARLVESLGPSERTGPQGSQIDQQPTRPGSSGLPTAIASLLVMFAIGTAAVVVFRRQGRIARA